MLIGACGAPIQRVPHKYDVLFPCEIRKLYFLFFLVQQRKIRCCLSHRDAHILSSSSSQVSPSILPISETPYKSPLPSSHCWFFFLPPSCSFPSCCAAGCVPFVFLVPGVHSAQENPMSAEAAGRAPVMTLRELVDLYRSHAG